MAMSDYLRRFLDEEHNMNEENNIAEAVHLLAITKGCRASMHEPDEQGVSATVFGERLDNAGVEGEFMLYIKKDTGPLRRASFNLASLIALARIGADVYLHEVGQAEDGE